MVGVSILKFLGLENSKTVTPLQVADFQKDGVHFEASGHEKGHNGDSLAGCFPLNGEYDSPRDENHDKA